MIVKKFVLTKNGYTFRRVKSISKIGLYWVEYENEIRVFNDTKEVECFEELATITMRLKDSYRRNKNIDTILKDI